MTDRKKRDSRVTANVFSELGPVIPPFSQASYTSRTRKSENFSGIEGIGLGIQDVRSVSSVPVPKTTKSFPTIVKAGKPGKTVVHKAVQVSSNEENLFLIKIEALEKEIFLLKSSVKEKEDLVKELNKSIETKTLQFTRDIEHEVNDHRSTRQMLERSQRIVEEKEQLLEERIQHYEKVNRDLQDKYEEMLASLREQSQTEVNIRDDRINKLKQQISELFKEKSWYSLRNVFDTSNFKY
ncbi:uncharacterized protein LOC142198475 [Leptodactylus fuscus]|uniref:uncharacterized protein LOC142198475 n=1 Tax=Leptodactylus fuscus TaxID=238119 RepID=UPI003F4E86B2